MFPLDARGGRIEIKGFIHFLADESVSVKVQLLCCPHLQRLLKAEPGAVIACC